MRKSASLYTIRKALLTDVKEICRVLVSSIRELCAADHGNEEARIQAWSENKNTKNVEEWLGDPENYFVVAQEKKGPLIGVAAMRISGEVMLCYVTAQVLHRGVGKKLMRALERKAIALGLKSIRLNSSSTARAFYERNGFVISGSSICYGMPSFKMTKALTGRLKP